jgi:hypothetical protein
MDSRWIFLLVLAISFLQVLHIFEEIALNAYALHKGKNARAKYLRVAAVLVFLNYIVLTLLFWDLKIGFYAAWYSVVISVGNTFTHLMLFFKKAPPKKWGYGLPSSIPMGLTGLGLAYLLVRYWTV